MSLQQTFVSSQFLHHAITLKTNSSSFFFSTLFSKQPISKMDSLAFNLFSETIPDLQKPLDIWQNLNLDFMRLWATRFQLFCCNIYSKKKNFKLSPSFVRLVACKLLLLSDAALKQKIKFFTYQIPSSFYDATVKHLPKKLIYQ